jgi:predicted transcriptional regulator
MKTAELTTASLETFLTYARDAGNWTDTPLVSDGNITCTKEMRGNLTDLKKKGLIRIDDDGEYKYVVFTKAGSELAAQHGIEVQADAE